jgi:hypothetical protein
VPADRVQRLRERAYAVARERLALPPDWPEPAGNQAAAGPDAAPAVPVVVAGGTAGPPAGAFADAVRRELGELVATRREAVLDRLAEVVQGDPARRHARRIRRVRRRLRAEATVATGLAGLTAAAVATSAPEVAEVGLGAGAVLLGAAAVRAGRRLTDLRRRPAPPARVPRPPKDSPARALLDRLASQEQTLHALLAHLGDAAAEPRRVAASAAAGLRELGARLTAVDRAHRLSGELADAVDALRRQLHAGIASYDALVVAAADAVAADAGLRTPAPSLQEATDALAGLAAGLRAVA